MQLDIDDVNLFPQFYIQLLAVIINRFTQY